MTATVGKKISMQVAGAASNLILRTAEESDLPALREWKNVQSEFFFFKGQISPEKQVQWFRGYQERPEDFMWIVQADGLEIGCMGIRKIDDAWDVYNVILGSAKYSRSGLMSHALQSMLAFARQRAPLPITLKVLKKNPAVTWYQKNGFVIALEAEDYFFLSFQFQQDIEGTL
jgi:RimJ/RimL family protein N-acetyltransferase